MNPVSSFINQRISIRIPVWTLLLLPFVSYLLWELFWYKTVGLRFIAWHTHLMVFVYLWLLGFIMLRILLRKNSSAFKNFLLAFSSVIFALFIAELYLELSGVNKTYLEKVGGRYSSPYAPGTHTHYHTWPPHRKEHWIEKNEFRFWRPNNSYGIGDREWEMSKQPGEIRLLALGDSFTEGDGAPYDSSYVALLDTLLRKNGFLVYTMNGGVSGSDPFYDFVHLRDKLHVYHPDIILQSLSTQDMTTDIILRGGFERFLDDRTTRFIQPPWWEPLYAISYLSRLYFHHEGYTELLRKEKLTPEEEQLLNRQLTELFSLYADFCTEKNIRLIVMLRPDSREIEHHEYEYDFTVILNGLHSNPHIEVIDLLPEFVSYIQSGNTQTKDYFWKYDGHHNPKGYLMMAECVFNQLKESIYASPSSSEEVNGEKYFD